MTYQVTRDCIGHGANSPNPLWPGSAKLTVNFVMVSEEGDEPSFAFGNGVTDNGLTKAPGLNQVKSRRDLIAEGAF